MSLLLLSQLETLTSSSSASEVGAYIWMVMMFKGLPWMRKVLTLSRIRVYPIAQSAVASGQVKQYRLHDCHFLQKNKRRIYQNEWEKNPLPFHLLSEIPIKATDVKVIICYFLNHVVHFACIRCLDRVFQVPNPVYFLLRENQSLWETPTWTHDLPEGFGSSALLSLFLLSLNNASYLVTSWTLLVTRVLP